MQNCGSGLPFFEQDLFEAQALRDPWPSYKAIRDLGPVVRLCDPDVYMISRFTDVRDALRSPDILVSGQGIGFSETFNAPQGVNVIQSDGDLHRLLRSTVARPLSPAQIKPCRGQLRELMDERVRLIVDTGPFDALRNIASLLPVGAISSFVGLREDGRAKMLAWAAATFNVIGPPRTHDETDFALVREARDYLLLLDRSQVVAGGWADTLFATAETGRIDMQQARAAMSAYVLPSLDTTINATGLLLHNLACRPDQWARLRADPALLSAAVMEGVRHSAVVRWFSRVAIDDYSVDGCVIPSGARVMLMYASANRDERRYDKPDSFEISRDARDQLAWGTGPHMCVGMHLARMEMEVLLEVLLDRVAVIEVHGAAYGVNHGLYGFEELTIELKSA